MPCYLLFTIYHRANVSVLLSSADNIVTLPYYLPSTVYSIITMTYYLLSAVDSIVTLSYYLLSTIDSIMTVTLLFAVYCR